MENELYLRCVRQGDLKCSPSILQIIYHYGQGGILQAFTANMKQPFHITVFNNHVQMDTINGIIFFFGHKIFWLLKLVYYLETGYQLTISFQITHITAIFNYMNISNTNQTVPFIRFCEYHNNNFKM